MSPINYKRAKKIMAIALDMHQAKEIRIQAVRVLKLMDAVDELWIVAHNVKCPFTRQSAIESIPALEVRSQTEQIGDRNSIPENTGIREEGAGVPTQMSISSDKLEWP